MEPYILAWDLGTGGNKTALYSAEGQCLITALVPYETHYPTQGWHEQCPADWWNAVVEGTRRVLAASGVDPGAVACCGISGQSLGVVPLDRHGELLRERTPIWSDARAGMQAACFFEQVPEHEWYTTTGNGFPPPLYAAFKIMWYRDHEPEMFERTAMVTGSKDFINYRLTGEIVTDPSYASGSGVYDLLRGGYSGRLLAAGSLPARIFPQIVPSTQVIGRVTPQAAGALGLPAGARVVAGGVDNACMALGARNVAEGRVYNSLGSSSWIAVSSAKPLLDRVARPFVFAHVIPGLFTSATSIFSAGSSFRWVRDHLCVDLGVLGRIRDCDSYDLMTAEAARSPAGANGVLFNPSLAGGTALDGTPHVRGAFIGLDLRHTRADLIRAAMEGIALGLRRSLDVLRRLAPLDDEMVIVGGGSRSALWRRICADVYGTRIVKTDVDQGAATLGATALAAVGTGLWRDFSPIDHIHRDQEITEPIPENVAVYERLLPIYERGCRYLGELGDLLMEVEKQAK
jgi:xylulokinase